MHISKSKFIKFCQCPKLLWLDVNHPELADEMNEAIFAAGTAVGELARGLFPGGVLVEYDASNPNNIQAMISRTQELIQSGQEVIYEAAFGTEGLLVICDILVRTEEGSYDVIEVKSSTEVKPVYIKDTAFQAYVLEKVGISVRKIYVAYINKNYIRDVALDIQKLFTLHNVTFSSNRQHDVIENTIPLVFETLNSPFAPETEIGVGCHTPYDCAYQSYCRSHLPEVSVFELTRLTNESKYIHYYDGIITFEDVREKGIHLSKGQRFQVDSYLDDIKIVNKEAIKEFLDTLHYPLYFLDFETYMPAIPKYDGMRPYQQIPTQYSLHCVKRQGSQLEHQEFLADETRDPREELALRLINDIPADACVLAYNMTFEKSVIKALAEQFPKYRRQLMRIHDQIKDLMSPFQSKAYYLKEMRGRYSIKNVLPALFPDDPELSYDNVGLVHNGGDAMNAYASLEALAPAERAEMRKALLDYCRLDTLAMVKIWERLRELVN